MLDLLRLFQREEQEPPATQTDLGGTRLEDVQAGYRDLLLELLQSGGVPADSVSVSVPRRTLIGIAAPSTDAPYFARIRAPNC